MAVATISGLNPSHAQPASQITSLPSSSDIGSHFIAIIYRAPNFIARLMPLSAAIELGGIHYSQPLATIAVDAIGS